MCSIPGCKTEASTPVRQIQNLQCTGDNRNQHKLDNNLWVNCLHLGSLFFLLSFVSLLALWGTAFLNCSHLGPKTADTFSSNIKPLIASGWQVLRARCFLWRLHAVKGYIPRSQNKEHRCWQRMRVQFLHASYLWSELQFLSWLSSFLQL